MPVESNQTPEVTRSPAQQSAAETATVMPPLGTDQKLRIGAYTLLASLLRDAPDDALLEYLQDTGRDATADDDIGQAMLSLAGAAQTADAAQTNEEFHDLFIGIGRGELVPFGSWYLTGFLMEKPLSLLRTDLQALGFERQPDVTEPEDHVAALAEVMAMLISDNVSHQTQQDFFEKHLSTWMGRFFTDLQNAGSASFYRAVGQFGDALIKLESRYFSMRL